MFYTRKERKTKEVSEAVHSEVFCEKGVFRSFAKFTGKHLCQSLFLINFQASTCNFTKNKTLTQVFSCEFCKISKNTFSYRTPPVAASELYTICKMYV